MDIHWTIGRRRGKISRDRDGPAAVGGAREEAVQGREQQHQRGGGALDLCVVPQTFSCSWARKRKIFCLLMAPSHALPHPCLPNQTTRIPLFTCAYLRIAMQAAHQTWRPADNLGSHHLPGTLNSGDVYIQQGK